MRSGPGTNTRRVGQLRAGRFVQVDQVCNGWLHIRGQGWISGQFARRA
ncbi:SH3 domain-containing protein [Brevundimonas sp.]